MELAEIMLCKTEKELSTVVKMHNGVLELLDESTNLSFPSFGLLKKGTTALPRKEEPKTLVYVAMFVTQTLRITCASVVDQLFVTSIEMI